MKTVLRLVIWPLLLVGAGRASVISVDFKNTTNPYGSYSGVEALAAAANADFGNANVWNNAVLGYLSPVTNPSFSGLVDSTGLSTGAGIQFTGAVDSFTGQDGSCGNSPLFCDFIYLNSGVLDWTITGLAPGTTASIYFYNYQSDQAYRNFNMALDTDGDGTLDSNYTVDVTNGGYAANTVVSSAGTISGEMQWITGQASWSGFQLDAQTTPEPASWALLAGAIVLLARWRKRKAGTIGSAGSADMSHTAL